MDCRDGSDEQNCIIYIKDANYEESITPPPTKGKELMEINISITIYDIIGVNEGESKFAVRFRMTAAWKDPRLDFFSLNEDERKNVIENSTDIWVPQIGFIGVITPVRDHLEQSEEIITASKTENGTLSGPDCLENIYHYHGDSVIIKLNKTFVGSFLCLFDNIYQYPFDTETCSIKMVITGKNYGFTQLVASDLDYKGIKDVNVNDY